MQSYSTNDIILVRYPFSDLSASKVRPAVVVSIPHSTPDLFIVPLTSKTKSLRAGEFILEEWEKSGLNVESAIKRGIYTVQTSIVHKKIGELSKADTSRLRKSLKLWLGL